MSAPAKKSMLISDGCAVMDEISEESRVYVDNNIFVYFLESLPSFFEAAQSFFAHADAVGARLVTSEFTLAECLYQPSRNDDLPLVSEYELLIEQSGDVELIALDGALAKRASFAGGKLGLKLADAIHYISALEAGCDFFVTADAAFKSGPAMKVLRLAA
jgi:predicted nucleic acid-binding protein